MIELPLKPIGDKNDLIQCPYGWIVVKSVGCDEPLQLLCKRECKTRAAEVKL